ncbi:hypothetical protein [Nitrospirillum sp. BR 11828]|uniref:hypothetical protein n=1 Tax=Nitrospirillum sp. BR 11828 TaxID=3104325 RepID=UPI002ACA507D|nr:hypothetical protein [Nitrospirillum sp. BR 11828]MDZ5650603.1 hypothetical protein [Nitrospirillum sp. BR 11828]
MRQLGRAMRNFPIASINDDNKNSDGVPGYVFIILEFLILSALISYNAFGIFSNRPAGLPAEAIRCQIPAALLSIPAMAAGLFGLKYLGRIKIVNVTACLLFFFVFLAVLLSCAPGCFREIHIVPGGWSNQAFGLAGTLL